MSNNQEIEGVKQDFDHPVIYVVDDDDAMRQSLAALVGSMGYQVNAYSSADTFLSEFDNNTFGCVILDVRMPGMSGVELLEWLRERGVSIPVVVITAFGDVPTAVRAMHAGAADFLEKPFRDQELLDLIHRCLKDHRKVLVNQLKTEQVQERMALLTPREQEVMSMVVKGQANRQVAEVLGLSTRTVEIHRARVMEKMQASSLAELVRMVLHVEEGEGH